MPDSFLRHLSPLLLLTVASAAFAAPNERITVNFSMSDAPATLLLREQDGANHYRVMLHSDKLEFVVVKEGKERILGSQPVPLEKQYRNGEQWTVTAAASGNMISGTVVDNDGVEITSGTVFDRTFDTGDTKVKESPGITWSNAVTEELPAYVTAPGQIRGSYDVVIAGAGTAGTMAAIQAARLGSSVLLIEESDWIGGQMAAAAVTSMDEGAEYPQHGVDRHSVRERGLYREFFNHATHLYRTMGISTDTCYVTENHFATEPATAQALLYEMFQRERLAGALLDVTLETSITKVLKSGNTVTGVELLVNSPDGTAAKTIQGKILIDATEYGDILPLAGARYRVGNLISDNLDMSAAEWPPVQDYTWAAVIEQYPQGAPPELMMSVPPTGYNKNEYALALDNPEPTTSTKPWSWQRFVAYRGMPNIDNPGNDIKNPWAAVTKTHMNIGANDAHMDAKDIVNMDSRLHKEYLLKLSTLKLLYYIQNDMTEPVTAWTVALDEGFDTPYNRAQNRRLIERYPDMAPYEKILNQFPPIPYARESRRMIGVYTVRASDIDRRTGPLVFPTSIAVGDYAVDLHGADSPDELELELDAPGDLKAIGFAGNQVGPFTIPFESLVPESLDGFLAAEKNFSQSRLVSGATRLQPSTMLIGQAAGAIAGLSVAQNTNPRELHPAAVQKALLEAGDTLFAARHNAHKLPGVQLDTELWHSLQLCLLYGVVHLADAQQHLHGMQILSGATGATGWSLKENSNLQFSGDTTGLAIYPFPQHDQVTSASARDYTVTADLMRSSGSGTVGVVGRVADTGNFYHARLFSQKLELYKWLDNKAVLLAAAPVRYQNGATVKLTMQFGGDNIHASLTDANGQVQGRVSVKDASHTSGPAGLRIQPGANHSAEISSFSVSVAGSATTHTYNPEYNKPPNFATDGLTRAQFALHLARYLGLEHPTGRNTRAFADVSVTHPAYESVQALQAAGIRIGHGAPTNTFAPSAPVTKSDIAVALVSALKLPVDSSSAAPQFADVPPSHPAFQQIQTLVQNKVASNTLLQNGDKFSPEQNFTMADSLNLFADLLVNPPAGSEKNVPVRTKPRPIQ